MYGGGSPFDIIKYLAYSSDQSTSVVLGNEFVSSVVDTEFSTTCLFPLTRAAFLCCNLTAPKSKIQDGFSRLLTRCDVTALKGKKMAPKLQELETTLERAWLYAKQYASSNEGLAMKSYGKLQVRAVLHVLKKSKLGHEDCSYAGLDEIYQQFEADMAATLLLHPKHPVLPSAWGRPRIHCTWHP
eukprot:s5081_g1.t1